MSTRSIYEVLCDGPSCTATAVVRSITAVPEGWRRIGSTEHLKGWKPGGRVPGRGGRTRADQRSSWDIQGGAFSIHLCPAHGDAFDEHLPMTEGGIPSRGDQRVSVGCSCGAARTSVINVITIASSAPDFEQAPLRSPERAWWRHLPPELRGYAGRAREQGK